MKTFARLLGYVFRHKPGLGLAFVIALTGMLFELARPWPIKFIVDYVLSDQTRPVWVSAMIDALPGAGSQTGLLLWSVFGLAAITIGAAALAYMTMAATVSVCYRMVYDLACELFGKLQRLSMSYHQRQSVGDLIQRMSGDVFVVHIAVSGVLLPATVSMLTLVGMFIIMLAIDPVMAGVSMVVVPALAVSLTVFAKPMDTATRRRYDSQASLMSLVEQSLSGIRIVQGYAREAYVQGKMEHRARDLGKAYNKDIRVGTAYQQSTMVITGIATALVLGLGAWRVTVGYLSLGDLLVFIGYLAALYGPVNAIATAVGAAVTTSAQARRVFEVIDSSEEIIESDHPVMLDALRGDVAFEQVSFGYAIDDPHVEQAAVLHDVSFKANRGEIIAIVGETGVGKSTLVSLLSRFHDPWDGRVLVDGHDVRDLPLSQLRRSVSLVLQEPFLFPISVAENIAFGRADVTREQIESAAKTACAHDFIARLPEGYDTVITERGSSLSGGERQRIAIARAILTDSPILVLDEPTSAVDARTEAEILSGLADSARQRTTFVVSHRLSTIRRADQIIVLDQGRIVERGRHDQLITKGVVYPRLYRHQERAML